MEFKTKTLKVNESRYAALFQVSGSTKKLLFAEIIKYYTIHHSEFHFSGLLEFFHFNRTELANKCLVDVFGR